MPASNPIQTIDDVLIALNAIIDETVAENSMLAAFAYVYYHTTARIKAETQSGGFEDNSRMEHFDVVFAKRYIDAYYDFKAGREISDCWRIAFEAKDESITIMQHVMLGMNAHINYDLSLTAVEVMAGGRIEDIRNDFFKVNDVLASLTNDMQVKIGRVSRLMFLLDWIGAATDEKVINFSITKARTQSWNLAENIFSSTGRIRETVTKSADENVTLIGDLVRNPRFGILKMVLKIIRRFETKDVAKMVAALRK